jgi:hypothetical protein
MIGVNSLEAVILKQRGHDNCTCSKTPEWGEIFIEEKGWRFYSYNFNIFIFRPLLLSSLRITEFLDFFPIIFWNNTMFETPNIIHHHQNQNAVCSSWRLQIENWQVTLNKRSRGFFVLCILILNNLSDLEHSKFITIYHCVSVSWHAVRTIHFRSWQLLISYSTVITIIDFSNVIHRPLLNLKQRLGDWTVSPPSCWVGFLPEDSGRVHSLKRRFK